MLLQDIAWSFSEPVPSSPEELVDAVESYHARLNLSFNRAELTDFSPFTCLDISYEYAVEVDDGDWDDVSVMVRVGDGSRKLAFAEILWRLHFHAHPVLKDQDHHFFEGLALLEEEIEEGIPAYEVYLGS